MHSHWRPSLFSLSLTPLLHLLGAVGSIIIFFRSHAYTRASIRDHVRRTVLYSVWDTKSEETPKGKKKGYVKRKVCDQKKVQRK
jgi:hypothetical protein